ncbi:MAG: hypothetical protein WBO48_10085, partial [Candidatus Promineifilaceae bacterium]
EGSWVGIGDWRLTADTKGLGERNVEFLGIKPLGSFIHLTADPKGLGERNVKFLGIKPLGSFTHWD